MAMKRGKPKAEPRKVSHLKKGDEVIVLSGKDKGKKGKILTVISDKGKAIVENVNFVKKHQRPTQKMAKAGIIEKEAALDVAKLMLVCPRCNKASRTGSSAVDGRNVRVCVKCEEIVDRV